MSGGRPASLDGSLLARKGAATPAIPDESPLVLQLDEHRLEPVRSEPEQAADQADEPPVSKTDFASAVSIGLHRAGARIGLISPRLRLAVIGVAAVAVVAVFWPADNPEDTVPPRADSTPAATPVDGAGDQSLKLNLTAAAPEPSAVTVAMPVSAALAVSGPSNGKAAPVETVTPGISVAPVSKPVIPVNVPSSETAPSVGGVESTPEIPATVPKSVSPVPIPKPKPVLAVIPGGPYAVQLASIANEKGANKEAFRLQKHLGQILGGREIKVEKAVIKGKGTMYRLRATGYRTQAEARAACAQIGRLKVDCLPIKR